MQEENKKKVGVVVIGRNEGDRLKRCLQSVLGQADIVVYVDSGSSDSSVEYATSIGVHVVELDMSIPFSAGRARNEGCFFLLDKYPELEFVQFVDGDCELVAGWMDAARKFLENNSSVVIVAGRRKERYPENSIYNRLCDIEWNTPVGEAKSCGGDFMVRAQSFLEVNGFNPSVIAGEEPELCYRLRQQGGKIYRLDNLMTLHDADITSFSQWWRRAVRSGHAYAQGYALHGRGPERYCLRDSLRIWFWAFVFPGSIFLFAFSINFKWLLVAGIYSVQIGRISLQIHKRVGDWKLSVMYGFFNVLGKWPQLLGQMLFWGRKLCHRGSVIIEYK